MGEALIVLNAKVNSLVWGPPMLIALLALGGVVVKLTRGFLAGESYSETDGGLVADTKQS